MSKPRDQVRQTSRYLSKILRHQPESIGLELDAQGWGSLSDLIRLSPPWVTRERVEKAVSDNDKQRFTIKDGRIRANQGHSIKVDLGMLPVEPPEFLYHGTYRKVVAAILAGGLKKMNRHHVHMAAETGTAVIVGKRQGAPVVFKVLAGQMHRDGYEFFQSTNGVWLTDHVPPKYLEQHYE